MLTQIVHFQLAYSYYNTVGCNCNTVSYTKLVMMSIISIFGLNYHGVALFSKVTSHFIKNYLKVVGNNDITYMPTGIFL